MGFFPEVQGQAYNRTRETFLATKLSLANTHWLRLRGLVGASELEFTGGCGLLIVPCRGVHTLAMSFPIDVIYLDEEHTVVHVEQKLKPWRFAPIRMRAATVLELPSGKAVETATAMGDKIEIRLDSGHGRYRTGLNKSDLTQAGLDKDRNELSV